MSASNSNENFAEVRFYFSYCQSLSFTLSTCYPHVQWMKKHGRVRVHCLLSVVGSSVGKITCYTKECEELLSESEQRYRRRRLQQFFFSFLRSAHTLPQMMIFWIEYCMHLRWYMLESESLLIEILLCESVFFSVLLYCRRRRCLLALLFIHLAYIQRKLIRKYLLVPREILSLFGWWPPINS